MAWIESHQGLARHIKTKRLARKLETSVPAVIGHLHLLWWWSMDNTPDGNLSELEAEDIAEEMMWNGEPEKLISGLLEVGFLDNVDGQLFIHDFYDYVGKLVEKRKADAERKRNGRRKSEERPEDVQRTSNGHTTDVPRDGAGNSTVPNSTEQKEKAIQYLDHVSMTEKEYNSLLGIMTVQERAEYMDRFNVWITGQKPSVRKNRSAYLSICQWYRKDQKNKPNSSISGQGKKHTDFGKEKLEKFLLEDMED